jgi:hypothetical protein
LISIFRCERGNLRNRAKREWSLAGPQGLDRPISDSAADHLGDAFACSTSPLQF